MELYHWVIILAVLTALCLAGKEMKIRDNKDRIRRLEDKMMQK